MTGNGVVGLAAAVLLLWGCGGKDDSPMAGMTAEEHARMLAGGTQGAVDSVGLAVREAVHLTEAQERALGVVYTTVGRDTLARTIRTVARIEAPESAVVEVSPKIEGFVERLHVNFTGQNVRRGQPLLTIYSPMLVAAQEELLTAMRLVRQVDASAGEAARYAQLTLESARRRLAYWDITAEQVARIERTGEVTRTLTLVSPVDGIVLAKDVVEGQRVMPGMLMYRIADLREVWVEGEVFEQDLPFVHVGSQAHFELAAYPGEHLMGRVSFVYPTVDPETRTNRVRITTRNPGLRLRPGMYATLYFDVDLGRRVLNVPLDAVVVTGERNVVFVRREGGMLMPREVVLGARGAGRVQILAGLSEGETIVASANFLVDAESRLASTGSSMPGSQHGGHAAPAPATPAKKSTTPPEHIHD